MGKETQPYSGVARRSFFAWTLKAGAFLSVLAAVPSRVLAFFVDDFPVRSVEKSTFRFNPENGMIRWNSKREEPYTLTVDGLVEKKIAFTYDDVQKFRLVTQVSDFHCVEGWSVADVAWSGFRFSEILQRVKPKPEAKYAIFHALGETNYKPDGLGHYVESFPVGQLLEPGKECLLALSLNGKPLSHDHGAPLRVVAPYELGYKSIKYVTRIELSSKPQKGWWTLSNPIYPIDAPVPKSRLRKKTDGKS